MKTSTEKTLTPKEQEVIDKLKSGVKLYRFDNVIYRSITYKFEDNTKVNYKIGDNLIKKGILGKFNLTKTLGGFRSELQLNNH